MTPIGRPTIVKMCGMQSPADVAAALDAGADALGFIFTESERRVALGDVDALLAAIPAFVARVAVVADGPDALLRALVDRGFTLQFCGDESAAYCERVTSRAPYVRVRHLDPDPPSVDALAAEVATFASTFSRATLAFDTRVVGRRGGTGRTFGWDVLAPLAARRPVVVSGGLTPENVGACVRAVRPFAVDVRSGVESAGMKDGQKMRAFVRAVREANAES